MLPRTYNGQRCSVARALEVVGERWTLLIVRDALLGTRRFDRFHAGLGIARNVLAVRLNSLVDDGLFERVPYQHRPTRYEYRLTPKGRALATVVVSLMEWGDRYLADEAGPPRVVEHRECGGRVEARLVCTGCARVPPPDEVVARPTARPARLTSPPVPRPRGPRPDAPRGDR